MNLNPCIQNQRHPARPGGAGAFSLVEIIIVVSLLSVIMLGLMMMFNQTQRAFRTSMTQTDVLESGRAITAMLSGELEELTPARLGTNFINFYMTNYGSTTLPPVTQALPGDKMPGRTNVLEAIYFVSRQNQTWTGIGYMVGTPEAGFGSLYRYVTNCPVTEDPSYMFTNYQAAFYQAYTNANSVLPTNMTRLVDGVVHFKVRVYDTNSFLTTTNVGNFGITNIQVVDFHLAEQGGEPQKYVFTDLAVPGTVEFEIGILEDRALARLKAIPDATFQRRQLTNLVGSVHLFRRRVGIRNVDPAAYQ